jgi:hypothetical protein
LGAFFEVHFLAKHHVHFRLLLRLRLLLFAQQGLVKAV